MNLIGTLQELAKIHGVDFVGVAGISRYQQEIESLGGSLAGDFPRALSIGIVLPKAIVNLLENREVYENVLQYKTHAYDVINHRLDLFSSLVSSIIQQEGYNAMPIPAAERIDNERVCASIPHKVAARLAGFGWIGKSCLLVNPKHGPRIRWTTVLTDAPFEENQDIMESQCGSCNLCSKNCPAQAINGRIFLEQEARDLRLDVAKCEAYFAELKKQNRLPICGMCLYICPYGRKSGHCK